MSFKKFRRTAIAEMREVESLEIDWFHQRGEMIFYLDSDSNNEEPLRISISDEDFAAGSPKTGDMIARNPDNHRDQWLVARDYFAKNFSIDVSEVAAEHRDMVYKPISKSGLDFGTAISAAKAGKKVARKGWNGKGMFAYIVPGGRFPVMAEAAKDHFGKGAYVQYRPYWALKTANEDVATWAPSGSDSLAEDWIILD